jgi:serine/threonine-protein kinase ATR
VKGLLTRNREWEDSLTGFHVESSWMIGDWADVQEIVETTRAQPSQVAFARLLLSLRSQDEEAIAKTLKESRLLLGARVSELGGDGHRQTYDSLVDLHLIHELELIHAADTKAKQGSSDSLRLSKNLASRFDLTLPTFSNRERILGMRKTAYNLR